MKKVVCIPICIDYNLKYNIDIYIDLFKGMSVPAGKRYSCYEKKISLLTKKTYTENNMAGK